MYGQNHDQQPKQASFSQNVNAVVAIAQYMSMIGEVFTRVPGTWGKRHASFHMGVSWIVMFLFGPLFFRQENPLPMLYLWMVATGLLLLHRVAGAYRESRGYRVHSLYTGRSIFCLITNSQSWAKGFFEPMAFALVGCLVGKYSPPMGIYLICVSVGAFVSHAWMEQEQQARLQGTEDAWHDAQYMQQEMQKRMGG